MNKIDLLIEQANDISSNKIENTAITDKVLISTSKKEFTDYIFLSYQYEINRPFLFNVDENYNLISDQDSKLYEVSLSVIDKERQITIDNLLSSRSSSKEQASIDYKNICSLFNEESADNILDKILKSFGESE